MEKTASMTPAAVKVMLGDAASKRGLADPVPKTGTSVTVFTECGSRKVKEIRVQVAAATKGKALIKRSTSPDKGAAPVPK